MRRPVLPATGRGGHRRPYVIRLNSAAWGSAGHHRSIRSHGAHGSRLVQSNPQRRAHAIERGDPVVDHRVAEEAMNLAVVAHDLDGDVIRAQPGGGPLRLRRARDRILP